MSSQNTQLTSAFGYNTNKLVFSKPVSSTIPNSALTFERIMISTKNNDGSVGELILPTFDPTRNYGNNSKPELFSFGMSENTDMTSGKVNGYTVPICLWNKDGATNDEKAWTDTFDKIVEVCKDHVLSVKDEIGKYDLERNDLKKFNPLYWKRDKGKVVDGTGPTLYSKIIHSKKNDKFITQFYDYNGNPIDPMQLMGKRCYGRFAVKFESIFIGNKISLQVKLYEAEVRFLDVGMRRLLAKPTTTTNFNNIEIGSDDDKDDEDKDEGSVDEGSDSDGEPTPVVKKTPAPVKKVLKRPVKK